MLQEIIQFFLNRFDFLYPLMLEHLQIAAISIIFASVIGIFTGIMISRFQKTSPFILGLISFIYTIPSISMLGFLIPFTGIGNTTAIIALSIYALLPIVRSTYTGLTTIDSAILEAARGMGSTSRQILWKIQLPLALPVIVSGFRNMVVMTIALAGIASFIGAGGLGVAIYRGITTNNTAMSIAGSIMVALLALLADFIIGLFEKGITRHQKKKTMSGLCLCILSVLLVIAGSLQNNHQKETIKIATKPMSEQFIIGEMMKYLIEDETDYQVQLTKGIGGGTSNIHPALLNGDFDLYPEYTGTAWSFVLKKDYLPDEEELYRELISDYQKEYQLDWVGLYGFNNTFGIAVMKETAQTYNLHTYSDLAKVSSELIYGGEYDFFERDDGFDAMAKAYGFQFQKVIDLDIGLKYDALRSGKIDVMHVFTTDGQLSDDDIIVLEDDRHFFENYYAGTIVRMDSLEKYPQLKDVLMKFDGLISEKEMAQLNYEVETNGRDEQEVAREFLISKGLLEAGS